MSLMDTIVPIVGRGTSLSDFGDTPCRLVFTKDCNLRCPYCDRGCFLPENRPTLMSYTQTMQLIINEKRMCDHVVITGGEPTIHKTLPAMIKQLSYHNGLYVKLDTNGTNPVVLATSLEYLDHVCLDLKTSLHKYNLLGAEKDYTNKILDSINLLRKQEKINYSFRITCVPNIVDEQDIIYLGKLLKGANKVTLRQFEPQYSIRKSYRDIEPFNRGTMFKFKRILKEYVNDVQFDNVVIKEENTLENNFLL